MKIALFGGSGRVGTAFARLAYAQGQTLLIHARSEEKANALRPYGEVVVGAIDDPAVLKELLSEADCAVSTLGTTIRKPNTVLSDITQAIIAGMQRAQVPRFVCVTSLGCGNSFDQVSGLIMRWLIRGFGREIWADKERQERHIIASDLDYLVVRPGGLSKKAGLGSWRTVEETEPVSKKQMIPIEDVAAYCLSQCVEPTAHRKVLTLLS